MEERVGVRSVTFHFVAFLLNIAGVYCDLTFGNVPAFKRYGGRARFLTHLSEFLSLMYTGFAFFVDVHHLLTVKKDGKHTTICIRDFLFAAIISPLTIMVPLLFWGIACVDLDGLMPPEHRAVVTLTGVVNQFLHTWPLVFNLACTILIYHRYPRLEKGLFTSSVVAILYIVWLFVIKHYSGEWVYPFLGNFSIFGFVAFFGCVIAVMGAMYMISEKLNENIWGHLKEKST